MAETTYQPSSVAELLTELRRLEKDSNQVITNLVKEVAKDGSVGNWVEHMLRSSVAVPTPLEILELKGTTVDAQRVEMRTTLLAGNAPIAYTVIAVPDAAGKVNDEDILLYRPDGGAWAQSLIQVTIDLPAAIVAVAEGEWTWFGKQEYDVTNTKLRTGKQEDSDDGSDRVAIYWREGVDEPGITGKDRNQYWSAAFISYVMLKGGAGALFRRSDHHSEYIYSAMVAAKEQSETYGYWGARLQEHAPEVGDLICGWRNKQITFDDAQKPGWYAAHCDLVVAKTADTVTVIGGNVSQSVTKRTFALKNGYVSPDTYPATFAILINRMASAAQTTAVGDAMDPLQTDPPPAALPKVAFQPLGEDAPIRGSFDITPEQLTALCAGGFAHYAKFAGAIVENSKKYSINPLFILADFRNQGVNAAYNNPWGISTDYYPYGPGKTQLGEKNGTVKNGPRKFGEHEWRIAFDRQFAFVATGEKYQNAKTIAQWALIDAPPGAKNDVHGTNALEGRDVGTLYNKLVNAFV